MEKRYSDFIKYLDSENKEKAVELIVELLSKAESDRDIVFIYTEYLQKSLEQLTCSVADKNICIWKEHVRSSIIRTIIECSYPYIIKMNKKLNKKSKGKVVVLCPDGEYHELGARMVSDYFMLAGFSSVYVGASTPKDDFIYAVNEINPDIVAISITNFYNLISAKKTILELREKSVQDLKIVVGGNAFINNKNCYKEIGADYLLNNYDDIVSSFKGVENASY